jgi:predicted porin
LAGYSPVDYDSDRLGADLSFVISDPVAKLHLPVTASFYKENFAPGSGMALPNSEETLLQLGLTALDTKQLCVDIGYARERIEQEFVAGESSSNSLRIGALLYPLPGLVGRLAVNRTDIDQALTINGYAESFDTTALELSYRYGRLSLRGGLDYREVDHVSSTAAFANNSKRRRLFLQGKQKLGAHITAMVRYEQDDISDPPSADSLISPLPLYYDETRKVIGKVDAALTNDLFLYGSLEKSRSENEARGSRLDLDGWGVGGYWQISNRLGASADYSRQKFDGFATDPVIAPWNALAPWMPDSRVATVSAYYRYDAQTSLRATMATARSVGASDSSLDTLGLMKDHFWELALDRTIDKNLAFSILYRYDSYRDNTEPGMSYRENQIMVILKSRN